MNWHIVSTAELLMLFVSGIIVGFVVGSPFSACF